MKVIFDPGARQDLEVAKAFYNQEKKGLGFEFLNAVEKALESIKTFPASRAIVSDPFRHLVMRRFPYAIIYSIEENHLFIVAIAHQHRDPDYWNGRLK